MIHHATSAFWDCTYRLPSAIQQLAEGAAVINENIDESDETPEIVGFLKRRGQDLNLR